MTYAGAAQITGKDLVVTHSIHLNLGLNVSVFQSEVLPDPDEGAQDGARGHRCGVLQEQILERIVEEVIEVFVPHVIEEIIEVVKRISEEQAQNCAVESNVDVPVPQTMEETVGGVKHTPQERVQSYTVEQAIDAPTPQMKEKFFEVVKQIVQDKVQERLSDRSGSNRCHASSMDSERNWKCDPTYSARPNSRPQRRAHRRRSCPTGSGETRCDDPARSARTNS